MSRRPPNRLRTHRLMWGLTQHEIAALLGMTKSAVTKYEKDTRRPSFPTALMYSVIFGVSVFELFPALTEAFEDALGARALDLCEQLENLGDTVSMKKLDLLSGIPSRAHKRHIEP